MLYALPMIYLIGGAPRVGKSILAANISQAIGVTPLSTDTLCGAFKKTLPPEEALLRFPLPGFSGDPAQNTLTPAERVELQLTSARSLQGPIEHTITEALHQGKDLVIEGVHVLPEQVRALIDTHGAEHFRSLFVGLTSADAVIDGIMKNTSPDNWMRESSPAVIRQVAEFVAAFSARLQEEATAFNLSYQERTADFEGDVRRMTDAWINGREASEPRTR